MEVAVVTGASMGLGEEFARQLARRGENLYLTARSADRLAALAAALKAEHKIEVHTFACDLAEPGAAARIAGDLQTRGLKPKWLVNNAGFGDGGPFEKQELARVTGTMMVNMVALTELCHLLLPVMKSLPDARIVNVASTAAFQPVPLFGVYAATKIYVLHFTEALAEELSGTSVKVLCLCPGATDTNFANNRGMKSETFKKGQRSDSVVRRGLAASDRGAVIYLCTRRLPIFALRFLPRAVVRKVAGNMMKSMTDLGGK